MSECSSIMLEVFSPGCILSLEYSLRDVTDHVIEIEFQLRGVTSCSSLWVRDVPKMSMIDATKGDDVCQFIEMYVTNIVQENTHENEQTIQLVKSLESHSHSEFCRHNGSCKFGFLKAPSVETQISQQTDNEGE